MIPLVKGAFVCTVHFILLERKISRHNGWCNWKQKPELGGYLVFSVCPTQTAPQFYKSNLRFLNTFKCAETLLPGRLGHQESLRCDPWQSITTFYFNFWLFLDFFYFLFLLHIKFTAWNSEVKMHFCIAY